MKILVPTDFSESANHASELAILLAQKINIEILFLHLVSTPVDWRKLPLERESLYPETKATIGDAKDKLVKLQKGAKDKGVEAHTSLVFNTAVEEIEKYVKKENHLFVVMGTHGTRGINKMLGTNTINLTEKSEVPVLVVKPGQALEVPLHWVIYTDFQENSRPGFEKLLSLAKSLEASVELLYVNTPYHFSETPEIEEKVHVFIESHKDLGISKVVINARNEEKGIENYIKSCQCDLLGLSIHRRDNLNQFFGRSITARLINNLEIPVISINDGH